MLGFQLVQEARIRLSITPEMKQSIHLLTLSGQELARYLQEAAEENPVLELEEPSVLRTRLSRRLHVGSFSSHDPLLQVKGAEPTLEHLLISQLRLQSLPPSVEKTAIFLAGCVNEDGYLTMDLTEVMAAREVSMPEAEAALDILQSLDPAGVGARNLRECLLLQIRRDPLGNEHAEHMVEEGLEELVRFHPGRAGTRLGLTSQQAQAAYDYISRLDPKPCRSMGCTEHPHYIVPDAVVQIRNNEVSLRLNSAGVPRVSLNEACCRWIREIDADEVWSGRAAEARAIIRSVRMRRRTLMRVLAATMTEQEAFLREGPAGLKPLNLAVIAEAIGMHESTVSRTVTGKYVQTPHGVFELKAFFASGLETTNGEMASAPAVKLRLKELIRSERAERPYSDSQLTALLAKEGIVISRRTVAKYREELQILPSLERKRWGK
ncbi:MAG TPA: RNA polymerase sigma-54 factor [Paenibacillus sp.]|uniref:RNA polymerase factor sigma-54 n=1 Tax=Paenibacillus TaxID=44249 RepID=UPI000BA15C3E|nr:MULTISPECIES: RNA polymerase factor sigma-54 [Paenibacillus]OZQ71706.1 RNA polymerase sigma-54 factor [Paenibacillus taichungensis]HBU80731.1 RNA polymerase sigma-54 factor [Paenibacillus sp.]